MGSRSCLGEVLQMGQEEQSRARRSHRMLDQHRVPKAAGVRAGWGLRAQLSVREQLNDVAQGRSTCSAVWANSHPSGPEMGWRSGICGYQPCCPV